ncbi:MAG: ATP-binding cassette domain-containing protein [Puniceicoccales bacterium]|jgi:ABC-type lipoprotein export system ATPase subunit|nr:ATP-binding cassette domain-containing protein [Puniceicoccales bacterium]
MNDYIVELKNIQKKFEDVLILNDVSLGIKECETVSICGESGSGKTTLINIMGLLELPTHGTILWEGQRTITYGVEKISQLRAKIFGYIFQRCNLIPELNVIENILFPKRITSKISTADIKFAKRLLQRVQLNGFEERNVLTLSGGESQRIAVVRAMINHPRIVIADEPTGSLDEKSAIMTMDMIINLCREYGSSLLLITHNQLFAKKMQTSYILDSSELGSVLIKMNAKNSAFDIEKTKIEKCDKVATRSKISLPSSKIGTT